MRPKQTGPKAAAATQAATITARLAKPAHRRAKIYAAIHGMDVQTVLTEAVDEYLKKRGA